MGLKSSWFNVFYVLRIIEVGNSYYYYGKLRIKFQELTRIVTEHSCLTTTFNKNFYIYHRNAKIMKHIKFKNSLSTCS